MKRPQSSQQIVRSLGLLAVLTGCTGGSASGSGSGLSDSEQASSCANGTLSGLIEEEGELFPNLGVIATSTHESSPVTTTSDEWGAYEIELAAEVFWSVQAVTKGFCAWEIPLELYLDCGEARNENLQLGPCDTG